MKILLVDDHALFRDGMRYVLRQLGRGTEILDAGSILDATALAEAHADLDLVLLGLNQPGRKGVLAVKQFRARHPAIPLAVISAHDRREDIERIMDCGAKGFISKTSDGDVVVRALRLVLDGGVYLPPQVWQRQRADRRIRRDSESSLTARQTVVLRHLADGLSNREIAAAIGLAEGTVKIHVASIFAVLGVNRRCDAVQVARRLGLLADTAENISPIS